MAHALTCMCWLSHVMRYAAMSHVQCGMRNNILRKCDSDSGVAGNVEVGTVGGSVLRCLGVDGLADS